MSSRCACVFSARPLSSTPAQPPPVLAYGFREASRPLTAAADTTMVAFGSVSLVTAAVGFWHSGIGHALGTRWRCEGVGVVRVGRRPRWRPLASTLVGFALLLTLGAICTSTGTMAQQKVVVYSLQRRYPAQAGVCGLQQGDGDCRRANLGWLGCHNQAHPNRKGPPRRRHHMGCQPVAAGDQQTVFCTVRFEEQRRDPGGVSRGGRLCGLATTCT